MSVAQTNSNKPTALVFIAPIQTIYVGVSSMDEKFFASVELVYPAEYTLAMVAIAKEVKRQRRKPHVYIWGNDIVVVFQVGPVSRHLLRKVYSDTSHQLIHTPHPHDVLFATAEAGGIDTGIIEKFTLFFGRTRYFFVSILDNRRDRQALWLERMTSFKPTRPNPSELIPNLK